MSKVYYYHISELKPKNSSSFTKSEVWILDAKKNLFTLELLEFYKYTSFSKFSYLTII